MSIFGNSDRFPPEAARSPGPKYHCGGLNSPNKGFGIVLKPNYAHTEFPHSPVAPVGQRDSWIRGEFSPSISIHEHTVQTSPSLYDGNINTIKSRFPQVSFPKSQRFTSHKASVSPGPQYNINVTSPIVGNLARAPKYSFAANQIHPNIPGSPSKSQRESWLNTINRKGILLHPTSSMPIQASTATNGNISNNKDQEFYTREAERPHSTVNFGTASRFGVRTNPRADQATKGIQRVQYISSRHSHENMGEFSPGPIYTPYTPAQPGGRIGPAVRLNTTSNNNRSESRTSDSNRSSRSCWLAGNIRKQDGRETMLVRSGDVNPGPGAYTNTRSAFSKASFSHNVKVKCKDVPLPKLRPSTTTTFNPVSTELDFPEVEPATIVDEVVNDTETK